MGTHLVIVLSLRVVLISVELCTFWCWARGGTRLGRLRGLIPPALPVVECSLIIEPFRSWTCWRVRVVWLGGRTNSCLTGQPFTSRSLKETVFAVGLSHGSWVQQSSMMLHNLSSKPLSISACGSSSVWGLGGRLADSTTSIRNDDQLLASSKGGSPANIWGGASMERCSGANNYCVPHKSSSQSWRHQ